METAPLPRLVFLAVSCALLTPLTDGATDDTRPPRIIQTTSSSLPLGFRADVPDQGGARVIVVIDENGHLEDWLVIHYSHPFYAQAAVAALQEWRYEPARIDGRPTGVRTIVNINFESRGRVVSMVGTDVMTTLFERINQPAAVNLLAEGRELDQPLAARKTVQPRFPRTLIGDAARATTVTVDFYVDERGRARLPVIIGQTHAAFAIAAVDALQQWEFDVPRVKGRPVLVRVQQDFVFANIGMTDT